MKLSRLPVMKSRLARGAALFILAAIITFAAYSFVSRQAEKKERERIYAEMQATEFTIDSLKPLREKCADNSMKPKQYGEGILKQLKRVEVDCGYLSVRPYARKLDSLRNLLPVEDK